MYSFSGESQIEGFPKLVCAVFLPWNQWVRGVGYLWQVALEIGLYLPPHWELAKLG